ncbi:MAG: S8 family serine peptidase [Planctomycetes bacterium]|nr:S8 family serine peptidase [Planctomycetota bacterium]
MLLPLLAWGLVITQSVPGSAPLHPSSTKLTQPLAERLSSARATEMVAAYVVLESRPDFATLGASVEHLPRRARGKALIGALRAHDGVRRGELLGALQSAQSLGRAERIVDLPLVNAIAFHAQPTVIQEIAAMPGVLYVNSDAPVSDTADATAGPPQPLEPVAPMRVPPAPVAFAPVASEHLVKAGVPACWSLGFDGTGIVVALLDDGTAADHPNLANHIWQNTGETASNGIDDDGNGLIDDAFGWNFSVNNNNTYGLVHGTRTAGLIVGDGTLANPGDGIQYITGAAKNAKLMLTTISSMGAQQSHFWACYQYAIAEGADLISSSHSWKWNSSSLPDIYMFRTACNGILAAGLLLVNSSGNQGDELFNYPVPFNIPVPANVPAPWAHPAQVQAGLSSVLSVSTATLDDAIFAEACFGPTPWENIKPYLPTYPFAQIPAMYDYPYAFGTGPGLLKPDVSAFSGVRTVTGNTSYYNGFNGSSAATPQVAAIAALMLQANPRLEPRHLAHVLQATAKDILPAGKDLRTGTGRIQAYEALKRGLVSVTADPQVPKLGNPVVFRGHSVVGRPTYLLISLNNSPLVLPGVAVLDVNVPLELIAEIPNPSSADFDFLTLYLPPQPAITGIQFWLQAACDDLTGATGSWLISPIETFTIGGW